jgi:hypothetical protein
MINFAASMTANTTTVATLAVASSSSNADTYSGSNGVGMGENSDEANGAIDSLSMLNASESDTSSIGDSNDSLEIGENANGGFFNRSIEMETLSRSDGSSSSSSADEADEQLSIGGGGGGGSDTPMPTIAGNGRAKSPTSSLSSGDEQTTASLLNSAVNDAVRLKLHLYNQLKTLPWKPKVRTCELEAFIDQVRKKFLGYGGLRNDFNTLVGLPYPIHESVKILKQHMYISLADEQIKAEERMLKYPLVSKTLAENQHQRQRQQHQQKQEQPMNKDQVNDIDDNGDESCSPAEALYASLLQTLPQHLICLLKILLTSLPQTRPKSDSLQIMSDLFPDELLGSHFLTIKLGIDTNRHKEIIIKAISSILLLMLKHFKVAHVYMYEYMCQHLLFANCLPLILKFFNVNISSFVQSKSNHTQLDFPACVIGQQAELDADDLENGDNSLFRWRNVFSYINLLRILNKLTKYKRARIMVGSLFF